uniref:Uncharacterized protein n=1 Tax=Sphaerodactylus townsendi TaxID=933632 RepID=A0ACB8ECE9_9SAUR
MKGKRTGPGKDEGALATQIQYESRAWAPERGAVAWQRERDEMRQEIHFLRRNMELLLARTEAAERGRQDPPPPEGERPAVVLPNDEPPGQQGPLGPPGLQPPQVPQRRRRVKARFDGTMEKLAYFLVQVEAHMEKYGDDYKDEIEQVHEVGLSWRSGCQLVRGTLQKSGFELALLPHFMLAPRRQFEDPL